MNTRNAGGSDVLTWLHVGDLHVTGPDTENYRDLCRIVNLVKSLPTGSLDFAVLPGDNADDGTSEQFRLVRDAVAALPLPLHILPGDHDLVPGSLDGFHDVLGAAPLPKALTMRGHRCLFLDVVSAGTGGPDFRLGEPQLDWVARELSQAEAQGQNAAVFMHTYPADLRAGATRLGTLLAQKHVACVDMGHTHYNEIANDGRTVFMATRSTGQIEEGPCGFSVAAIDGGGVSWRFKPIDQAWPCVLITRPVDRRLVTRADQKPAGRFLVRARILADAPIDMVEIQLDAGAWTTMAPTPEAGGWETWLEAVPGRIAVRARDATGRVDTDIVEPAGADWVAPARVADGSDNDRIGAWPAKGIFDTQLGPNRNGRAW